MTWWLRLHRAEYIRWINDQIDDVPVEKRCKWRRVRPVTDTFSKIQSTGRPRLSGGNSTEDVVDG